MEPSIGAWPARKRSWWFRGGEWAIELWDDEENQRHFDEYLPEDGSLAEDEHVWVCVNKDGSFDSARELEFWKRFGSTNWDRIDIENAVSSGDQIYFPLDDEPELYLRFAYLGRLVWTMTDGKYLSDSSFSDEDHKGFLSNEVREGIVNFHEEYGPPYQLISLTDDPDPHTTSIHPMLRQAQLIYMMTEYQRAILGFSDIGQLKEQITAIKESAQMHVEETNKHTRREWLTWRGRFAETAEKLRPGQPDSLWRKRVEESLAKYNQPVPELSNIYDQYDLTTRFGVLGAVKKALTTESEREYAVGGLVIEIDDIPSQLQGSENSWQFTFRFNHLMSVIWYQAFQATIRGALIRTCPSDNCDKPGGDFVAARPNQVYCSTTCRNYHNVQVHRRRVSKRDLLP